MSTPTPATLSPLKIWLLASRPKTLGAAIAPVLIGAAMAYEAGLFHWPSVLAALLGAIFIQIGTNYANDYFDYFKGADNETRLGPMRVTQAGLVTPRAMKIGTTVVFGLAFVMGSYLVWRAGWPIVVIGLLSILFGILYTAGPYPLAYLGIADIFVFIFFGPVAVGGTYYVQALSINVVVILAGFAPGLFSVAILTVNNFRDYDNDLAANKRTVVVRCGRQFACYQYMGCIVLACLLPVFLTQWLESHYYAGGTVILLYFGKEMIKKIFFTTDGAALNRLLAQTGLLLLAYSVIFSIGWIWPQ